MRTLTFGIAIGLAALMPASAQTTTPQTATKEPTRISSRRPLEDVAILVEHLYAKVVTYEEPLLTWREELEPADGRDPSLKWAIRAKLQNLTMPGDTGIDPDAGVVLGQALQAYHAQSGGTRFRVLTSEVGYHIVPEQVHDEAGTLVPAHSALDARITIPIESRTPLQHMRALVSAVSVASGVKISLPLAGKPSVLSQRFVE